MKYVAKTLAPVRRAARRFFVCDLRLRAGRDGLKLAFEEPDKARGPTTAELEAKRKREEVRQMARQLGAALDAVPDSRREMRHLGFFEQAFLREGLRALEQVPADVLGKALAQFEDLVSNWSEVGLASLRSRMAVAVRRRAEEGAPDSRPGAVEEGQARARR